MTNASERRELNNRHNINKSLKQAHFSLKTQAKEQPNILLINFFMLLIFFSLFIFFIVVDKTRLINKLNSNDYTPRTETTTKKSQIDMRLIIFNIYENLN